MSPPPQSSPWAFRPGDLPAPELLARDSVLSSLEHNPIFRFRRFALRSLRPGVVMPQSSQFLPKLLPFSLPAPLLVEFLMSPADPEMIVAGLWGYSLSLRGRSPFRFGLDRPKPKSLPGRIRLAIARIVALGCVLMVMAFFAAMVLSFFSALWGLSREARMALIGVPLLWLLPGFAALHALSADRAAFALVGLCNQTEQARDATAKALGRGPLFPSKRASALQLSVLSDPSMARIICSAFAVVLCGAGLAFGFYFLAGSANLPLFALAMTPVSALASFLYRQFGLALARNCRRRVPRFFDLAVAHVCAHLALLNEEGALMRIYKIKGLS